MRSGSDADMLATLLEFLEKDVPHQFVPLLLFAPVAKVCAQLKLPAPRMVAGNIVIGDQSVAKIALVAHLDESSFSVTGVHGGTATLSACHRFETGTGPFDLAFVGIRNGKASAVGSGTLEPAIEHLRCAFTGDVRLGDRAVYRQQVALDHYLLSAKAIEDRVGSIVAVYAASLLKDEIPVAVILTDGEQNRPEGYFSRTFPHILARTAEKTIFVFTDGIFQEGLERECLTGPQADALVVPHSGDGFGYSVPPELFALLRDDIVPQARRLGMSVRISGAYRSRGDDWGMVTNPTSGVEHAAFFVSFGGWGDTPASRTIDMRAVGHCVRFAAFAAKEALRRWRA